MRIVCLSVTVVCLSIAGCLTYAKPTAEGEPTAATGKLVTAAEARGATAQGEAGAQGEADDPDVRVLVGNTKKVMDGDTFKIEDEQGESWTIRLTGIDTPESDQPYGLDARNALRRFVINRTCRIEWTEKDRYQRILGRVIVDGQDVNLAMLRDGWAWHYKRYDKNQTLAAAEDKARAAGRGLWAEAKQVAPWDWRNGVREATESPANVPSIRDSDAVVFITKGGEKYHSSDCRHVQKSKIAIPLSRARSAYDACTVCNPG